MPGCGYVCPKCNDRGLDDEGNPCDWCSPPASIKNLISDHDWISSVHEGPCCSDPGSSSPNCTEQELENDRKPLNS